MSSHPCCGGASSSGTGGNAPFVQNAAVAPPIFIRRCLGIAEWIVPGAILALLPKCPLCIAAWFALATGFGLSMATLVYLRTTLVVFCGASLLYLAVRTIRLKR